MKKILTAAQIREIDKKTLQHRSISSLQLMQQASQAFVEWFIQKFDCPHISIAVFSGVGNNGGDGLVISQLLTARGYNVVSYVVEYSTKYSEECRQYLNNQSSDVFSKVIQLEDQIPPLIGYDVIIDALFGTGLSREISGLSASVIKKMNESKKTIVSVDVPSGLFLDRKTKVAVHADYTVSFQIPKLAFYMADNADYCGELVYVDIGLSSKAIGKAETHIYLTDTEDIRTRLKPLNRFAHKGTQGHALIVGGSKGKMGAVCLAAKAALVSGCGLVTSYVPSCGTRIVQTNFIEGMVVEDASSDHISDISFPISPNAIGVGVGMGKHEQTWHALHRFLENNRQPLVIDADALNILAQHNELIPLLPEKAILTPHSKELERLVGKWSNWVDMIQRATRWVKEYRVIMVLKGAYTLVVDGESIYVNPTGTAALATAGSGDVLTGIITGLLAQGYDALDAARIGVFLHGLTATISAHEIHPHCFTASDIIRYMGRAYFSL